MFGFFDPKDIQDLKNLSALLDSNLLTTSKRCYLNPTFGVGSKMVGGADADIIAGQLLIDIKTTKNLTCPRHYFNQLILYYILSLIGGVNGEENLKPIKEIGIYYSRHKILWKIPVSYLGDQNKLNEFKKWFKNYMEVNGIMGDKVEFNKWQEENEIKTKKETEVLDK